MELSSDQPITAPSASRMYKPLTSASQKPKEERPPPRKKRRPAPKIVVSRKTREVSKRMWEKMIKLERKVVQMLSYTTLELKVEPAASLYQFIGMLHKKYQPPEFKAVINLKLASKFPYLPLLSYADVDKIWGGNPVALREILKYANGFDNALENLLRRYTVSFSEKMGLDPDAPPRKSELPPGFTVSGKYIIYKTDPKEIGGRNFGTIGGFDLLGLIGRKVSVGEGENMRTGTVYDRSRVEDDMETNLRLRYKSVTQFALAAGVKASESPEANVIVEESEGPPFAGKSIRQIRAEVEVEIFYFLWQRITKQYQRYLEKVYIALGGTGEEEQAEEEIELEADVLEALGIESIEGLQFESTTGLMEVPIPTKTGLKKATVRFDVSQCISFAEATPEEVPDTIVEEQDLVDFGILSTDVFPHIQLSPYSRNLKNYESKLLWNKDHVKLASELRSQQRQKRALKTERRVRAVQQKQEKMIQQLDDYLTNLAKTNTIDKFTQSLNRHAGRRYKKGEKVRLTSYRQFELVNWYESVVPEAERTASFKKTDTPETVIRKFAADVINSQGGLSKWYSSVQERAAGEEIQPLSPELAEILGEEPGTEIEEMILSEFQEEAPPSPPGTVALPLTEELPLTPGGAFAEESEEESEQLLRELERVSPAEQEEEEEEALLRELEGETRVPGKEEEGETEVSEEEMYDDLLLDLFTRPV